MKLLPSSKAKSFDFASGLAFPIIRHSFITMLLVLDLQTFIFPLVVFLQRFLLFFADSKWQI